MPQFCGATSIFGLVADIFRKLFHDRHRGPNAEFHSGQNKEKRLAQLGGVHGYTTPAVQEFSGQRGWCRAYPACQAFGIGRICDITACRACKKSRLAWLPELDAGQVGW